MKFQPFQPTEELSSSFSLLFSNREKDVLHLLVKGLSSKQIAYELGLSKNTVDNHRQNMLKKSHTQCTAALIVLALKNGLY